MFRPASIILVDMDGVLADFNHALEEAWNYHPLALENNWFPLYEIDNPTIKLPPVLRQRFGEEAAKLFYDILSSGSFYFDLDPMPGAIEGMLALEEEGHDVMICTAPSRHVPTCASEKIEWAKSNLGWEWGAKTIIARDKTLIYGDYLIDDKHDIRGIHEPSWEHIVFKAPHNDSEITWETILDSLA